MRTTERLRPHPPSSCCGASESEPRSTHGPPVHVRSPPDAAPVPCSDARTADIEGGYTDDLATLAETIRQVVGAGAVGINLEDGLRDPDLHARKIAAALYLDAGASGIFVPGPASEAVIGALAEGIKAPLNIMLRPTTPAAPSPSG